MPVYTPNWIIWLSPLCGILGAWFLGVQTFQSGFATIMFWTTVSAVFPFVAYHLGRRVRRR